LAYANYGIVVFAALMLAGWWSAGRQASPTRMAAALWAPLGMLAAFGVNQPISAMVGEPRPYTALQNVLVLAHRSHDPSFPSCWSGGGQPARILGGTPAHRVAGRARRAHPAAPGAHHRTSPTALKPAESMAD